MFTPALEELKGQPPSQEDDSNFGKMKAVEQATYQGVASRAQRDDVRFCHALRSNNWTGQQN
jgi:hypothetical protein